MAYIGNPKNLDNHLLLAAMQSGGDPRSFLAILAAWAVQNAGRMAAAGGSARPLVRDPKDAQRAFSWARQVAERRQSFPDTSLLANKTFQLRPLKDEVGGMPASAQQTDQAILDATPRVPQWLENFRDILGKEGEVPPSQMRPNPAWSNNFRWLLETLGSFYER